MQRHSRGVRGLRCRCRSETCPCGEDRPDDARRLAENFTIGRLKQPALIRFAWSRATRAALEVTMFQADLEYREALAGLQALMRAP
jgi:hypothetical protein